MSRQILSIASSLGWSARISNGDDEYTVTLAAWALVDGGAGGQQVVGLVQRTAGPDVPHGTLGFADEVTGFGGYRYKGFEGAPT